MYGICDIVTNKIIKIINTNGDEHPVILSNL